MRLFTGAVLALLLPAAALAGEAYPAVKLLETGTTVTGETLVYPTSGPAKVSAIVVTIAPGAETVLHHHPAPMVAYILEGDLRVDYGAHGSHEYHAGDALLEAMAVPHKGTNIGTAPVRILAVSMGAEGTANAVVDAK
jgi:quercetin dioxygenase-like cupin family protein